MGIHMDGKAAHEDGMGMLACGREGTRMRKARALTEPTGQASDVAVVRSSRQVSPARTAHYLYGLPYVQGLRHPGCPGQGQQGLECRDSEPILPRLHICSLPRNLGVIDAQQGPPTDPQSFVFMQHHLRQLALKHQHSTDCHEEFRRLTLSLAVANSQIRIARLKVHEPKVM